MLSVVPDQFEIGQYTRQIQPAYNPDSYRKSPVG